MGCVQCERLLAIAIRAARSYHGLVADLECAHLSRDSEIAQPLSASLEKAFRERNDAIAELTVHESTHSPKTSREVAIEQATDRLGNARTRKTGPLRRAGSTDLFVMFTMI